MCHRRQIPHVLSPVFALLVWFTYQKMYCTVPGLYVLKEAIINQYQY